MFRNPAQLSWLIAAAAAALLIAAGAWRRRKLSALMGDPATLARLIPPETKARRRLKAVLLVSGLFCLALALAGPQWGVELVATSGASREVVIAVDTSLSMLTEDVKPSRLEKAKQELSLLLDQLRGDRVGVIAFAGEAAVVCPLTSDIDAAKQLLRSIDTSTIPTPGTGIGKAIRLAVQSLSRYPGAKTLVILSDGEDHKTDPLGAAEEAAAAGIKIYSVGIGTSEGEPIPLKDALGNLTSYKKDKHGATVVSKLSESTLTQIAAKSGGQYFRVSPSQNEAGDIADRIEKGEKSEGPGGTQNSYQNRFMIPLSLAFFLLLLEMIIPERGPLRPFGAKRSARDGEAGARAVVAGIVVVIICGLGQGISSAATTEMSLRKGNRLYGKEQYVPALEAYSSAGQRSPSDPRPVFNAGDALFRLNELDKAGEAFESIGKSQNPAPLREAAYYNLGNSHMAAGRYPDAVSDYRKAVSLDPNDKDAIYNLAVALHYIKNPPPKKKPDDKKKPPEQKPDDKKDKGGGQDKPQDGKGGQPPPTKSRPQDQISREDAQRIMRAVAEKEKAAGGNSRQFQKEQTKKQDVEEDW